MAARSENIDIIKKSLNKKIILIDRFIDSKIAYQHFGMGVDLNLIKTLNNYKGLKYRQQIIFENKNLIIINDSKSRFVKY